MSDPVFNFGGVSFGLSGAGLEKLSRKRSWRWPETEVVDAMRRLSFTGAGDDAITLGGAVFPGQYGDADAVTRLAALADAGEPYALVDSDGFAYGQWVITEIDEDQRAFLPGGKARRIDWTMTLKRHPDGG